MSTYFSVFTCGSCKHNVIVGFVGGTNYTVAFCSACEHSFRVAAAPGEVLRGSRVNHQLLVFGKSSLDIPNKSGRRTKRVSFPTWVESGVEVPVEEELIESGSDLRIQYRLNFATIGCPTCQEVGTLVDFRDYLRSCPTCGSEAMQESDLSKMAH